MDNPATRKVAKRKADREARREGRGLALQAALMEQFNRSDSSESENGQVDNDVGIEEEIAMSEGSSTGGDDEMIEDGLDQHVNEVHNDGESEQEQSDESEVQNDDSADEVEESDEGEGENEEEVGNAEQPAELQINDPDEYVRQQILEWTLTGGITMAKVDDLLKRLRPVHPNLPKCYKTLVQTPKKIEVVDCGNGYLWYFGITPQLQRVLSQEYLDKYGEVEIDVNIDSLPIFNKSSSNFIPILGRLQGSDEIFIIGIFCGDGSDPDDMDLFFQDFSDEVNKLRADGIAFQDVVYLFKIRNWILDQKARASVKCVKGVRGYFCCEKCTVQGVDHMNRMCLLDHNRPLRTDESFIVQAAALMGPRVEHYDDDEIDEHVTGVSPLLQCEQKMVSKFRLDSMHLVYKGVFLRWLDFLWNGRENYCLSPHEKAEISGILGSFREFCPSDFNRRPFAINSIKLKASELRRILLYDGIVAFRKIDRNLFKNFLLLHTAIFILCSPQFHQTLNDVANELLRSFVTHAEEVFGPHFIVYNVHSLVHLAAECLDNGTLDEFGAFPFENFLGLLKARITSKVKPLQQIAKREIERVKRPKTVKPMPEMLQMPRLNDEDEEVVGQQFQKIFIRKTLLRVKKEDASHKDSCCILQDDSVVIVYNIIDADNGPLIVGRKFSTTDDYYTYPINSSLLGIRKVSQLNADKMYFSPHDVKQKCYLIPLPDDELYAVIEFKSEASVHVVPSLWLSEDDNAQLITYWPPKTWTGARICKAIETCQLPDDTFTTCAVSRVLHSYNNYLAARANCSKAEYESSLETENEQLGLGRRHRKRIHRLGDSDDDVDTSPAKRSNQPKAPDFIKNLNDAIKKKLSNPKAGPSSVPSPMKSPRKGKACGKALKLSQVQKASPLTLKVRSCIQKQKSTPKKHRVPSFLSDDDDDNMEVNTVDNEELENDDPMDFDCDAGSPPDTDEMGNEESLSSLACGSNDQEEMTVYEECDASTENLRLPRRSVNLTRESVKVDLFPSEKRKTFSSSAKSCGSSVLKDASKTDGSLIKIGKMRVDKKALSESEQWTLTSLVVACRNTLQTIERLSMSILRAVRPSQKFVNPKDFPSLPLQTEKEYQENEIFLNDKTNLTDTMEYLSKFVNISNPLKEQVYSLLRRVLSDKLAANFNWKGTGEKSAFSESKLLKALTGALLDAYGKGETVNMNAVEVAIKDWLKNAPKRASSSNNPPERSSKPENSNKSHSKDYQKPCSSKYSAKKRSPYRMAGKSCSRSPQIRGSRRSFSRSPQKTNSRKSMSPDKNY